MMPQTPEEAQAEKGFVISDKRSFTKEGHRKEEADPSDAPPTSTAPPPRPEPPPASTPPPPRREPPPREAPARPPPVAEAGPPHEMPPADFATFIAMIANNVMMFLGQIPDPVSQQRRRDIQQAKHTIDILMMLKDKTQGNLSAEEQQLMQELLPQLQMAYVSVSRQAG